MYAILDIESTGGRYNEEGIIEIAILLYDGKEVVDRLISLVNPRRPIQSYVTKLTGIHEKMVRRAPRFHEIAKRIIEVTEDAIIVAHNVSFDYRMLQLEFGRLGYDYQRKTLDTIDLSEMLIPGLPGYGLEKVCDALGIMNTQRHRAEGDAIATLKLFELLMEKDEKKVISKLARAKDDEDHDHRFNHLTAELENVTGIYHLYNRAGEVIFTGRSNDLRNKINRHFLPTSKKARELQESIESIEVESTGSELLARVKEIVSLERLKPDFNKPTRPFLEYAVTVREKNGKVLEIQITSQSKRGHAHAYFVSRNHALEFAWQLADSLGIADQKNLIKESRPKNTEPIDARYKNWRTAIRRLLIPGGMWLLVDKGRHPHEKSFLFLDNGRVRGYGFFELERQVSDPEMVRNLMTPIRDDAYIRSIVKHFLDHKKGLTLRSLKKRSE